MSSTVSLFSDFGLTETSLRSYYREFFVLLFFLKMQ